MKCVLINGDALLFKSITASLSGTSLALYAKDVGRCRMKESNNIVSLFVYYTLKNQRSLIICPHHFIARKDVLGACEWI